MTHPPEQGQTLDAYGNEITLDVQIEDCAAEWFKDDLMRRAILASLRRFKAIDEAVVPEPVAYMFVVRFPGGLREFAAIDHYEQEGETIVRKEPLYGPEVLAYAQKSAEAARVAREECDLADKLVALQLGDIAKLESRLREVEARTVDDSQRLDDYEKYQLTVWHTENDWRGKKESGWAWWTMFGVEGPELYPTIREAMDAAIQDARAIPSSTDTEEK